MTRALLFHDSEVPGDMERALERISGASSTGVLVVGREPPSDRARSALRQLGLPFQHVPDVPPGTASPGPLAVLVDDDDPAIVSRALHACIDRDVCIAAPVTAAHFSRRTVYFTSIPKAGTHMMLRLFELMGLPRSDERRPAPGTWCTPTGYQYHAPCRELLADDWFEPLGRQPLLRSPGVFMYRHPLDIVVSELDWFVKPGHAFSSYLASFETDDDRLEALIADPSVMGTIRDRIMRYAGWVRFGNFCAVSYEELVGDRGGGSDDVQLDAIWALQLKLQIPGEPRSLAAQLYDPGSATFSRGRIGRHTERFLDRHADAIAALPQDFLRILGYERGAGPSHRSTALRRRPLVISELSGAELFTPRLVREDVLGTNIVEIAGRYFPVRQGHALQSHQGAQAYAESHVGFVNLDDAVRAATQDAESMSTTPLPVDARTSGVASAESELVVEGCLGFNVVRLRESWLAVDQSMGPTDLPSLSRAELASLESRGLLVTTQSLADALGFVLSSRNPRFAEMVPPPGQRTDEARQTEAQTLASIEKRLAELTIRWNNLSTVIDRIEGYIGRPEALAREAGSAALAAMPALASTISRDLPGDLVPERGFLGFDIVPAHGRWFAVRPDDIAGPVTPAREALSALVAAGEAVEGATVMAVKTGVLRVVLGDALGRVDELALGMRTAVQEFREHRHGRVE